MLQIWIYMSSSIVVRYWILEIKKTKKNPALYIFSPSKGEKYTDGWIMYLHFHHQLSLWAHAQNTEVQYVPRWASVDVPQIIHDNISDTNLR